MVALLLSIIYLAFISLGLPDSLLGSAWPVMHVDIGASLSWAGYISMIISVCTIISALLSDRLTRKLGTGVVTAVSVLLTALAMLGFSFAKSFWLVCLLSIPYGLGAGAIDACLNNYVALHFSSRHMSWLHCCWGIGATVSPYIMGACLTGDWSWMGGYRIVSIVQFVLAVIMFLAIPLWKKNSMRQGISGEVSKAEEDVPVKLTIPQIFRLKGAALLFVAFFCYCAMEQLPMVWASSYFVGVFGMDVDKAAFLGSMFFIGMTVGRAVSGLVAEKLGDKNLIRIGIIIVIASLAFISVQVKTYAVALIGFILLGLGCAPIYPSIIHSTPSNFGRQYSQSIIGVQMAFAYLGYTVTPLLFGLVAQHISIKWLPLVIGILAVPVLVLTEIMNKKLKVAAPK